MKFLSDGIGERVLEQLAQASEVFLAVAFFNPDDQMLDALHRVPKLKLIVSEEFAVTNPYKLEKLDIEALRSIPPDSDHGKLHAKVLMAKRRNNTYWVLVGSANVTRQGMFKNQEACIVVESDDPMDSGSVRQIKSWFDSLFQQARRPDLEQAKLIFDAQSEYVRVPRPSRKASAERGFWALKTTSGSTGTQHWPMFLAEKVVAVGWEDIAVDPSKVSDAQLRDAIQAAYPSDSDMSLDFAVSTMRKFVDLEIGAMILLCRGYTSTQRKDVHIHGVARIVGPFRAEPRKKGRWRFKHDAVIQEIDIDLPRDVVATALGKESLRQTIHKLERENFNKLTGELKASGVHVDV